MTKFNLRCWLIVLVAVIGLSAIPLVGFAQENSVGENSGDDDIRYLIDLYFSERVIQWNQGSIDEFFKSIPESVEELRAQIESDSQLDDQRKTSLRQFLDDLTENVTFNTGEHGERVEELKEIFNGIYIDAPGKLNSLHFANCKITQLSESEKMLSNSWLIDDERKGSVILGFYKDGDGWTLNSVLPEFAGEVLGEKPRFDFGWTSMIPPLLAIFLAIVTRRVLVSLFFGIAVGCGMLGGVDGIMGLRDLGNWLINSINVLFEEFLWEILVDEEKLRILWFVILMGAMVGVIHRSGGMHGIVDKLAPLAKTRVLGQFITWVMGLIIFFDDYANTLLLGNTMRPVTDRLKISREKLAYLVDSTAAPVAGLAIISTWVAMLISETGEGFKVVNSQLDQPFTDVNEFTIVVQTIPYRFYILFAIIFVPMVGLLGRDFGPMLKAERRAAGGEMPEDMTELSGEEDSLPSRKWYNAVLPILVLVGFTVFFLWTTGSRAALDDGVELTVFNVISRGDSYIALVYASLLGLLTAIMLPTMQKEMSGGELFSAAWQGVKLVVPAMAILWLAWALSNLTSSENLGTQDYIANLLTLEKKPAGWPDWFFEYVWLNLISVKWLPTAIFLISSFVAFATGSSWGTMGIMAPIVINVTYKLTTLQLFENEMGACPPDHPIILAAIASVISGSIFGDHCSPISDTTVLSSQASSCNHIDHVRTQMPYALFVGIISILFGTLPVGYFAYSGTNIPLWIVFALGVVSMLVGLLIFGRRPSQVADSQ